MMAIKHVLRRRQELEHPDVASCSHKIGINMSTTPHGLRGRQGNLSGSG